MATTQSNTILVSSCLLGLDSRYNSVCKKNQAVLDFLASGDWCIIPICPEQLAGLPTPRPPTQFSAGDGDLVLAGEGTVVNSRQVEMNTDFIKGAEQALEIALLNNCTRAILKERSPSCGVHQIYRNGDVASGHGVTTALLANNGISVYSEDDLNTIPNQPSGCKG